MVAAYPPSTSTARPIAAAESDPLAPSPSPRCVMSVERATSAIPSGPTSATSSRVVTVPTSIAASLLAPSTQPPSFPAENRSQ